MPVSKDVMPALLSPGMTDGSIDATALAGSTAFRFVVYRSTLVNVQIRLTQSTGSGTRSIWYVKGSIDGANFVNFSSPVFITTSTGAIQTGAIDVRPYTDIEVGLSTASTYSTERVSLVVMRSDADAGSTGPTGLQGQAGPAWAGGTVNSDVKLGTAGNGLYVKQGTNATFGQAILVGGSVVVSTNKVTANSAIFITLHTLGGIAVPAAVEPTARTPGTSFTITSASALDTSTYDWWILEPG